MTASPGSTLSFQRPLGRLRGGLRDALVLSLVGRVHHLGGAAVVERLRRLASGQLHGPARASRSWSALSGALLRWLRVPGPLVVLAQVVVVGAVVSLYIAGSPSRSATAWLRLELAFDGRRPTTAQQYAAPGAHRRTPDRPAADRRRRGLHAARRHPGRHAAPGAAGRAAAADDLQHPGQPARRRRLVGGVHADHRRLPADALPPGEPADRPLGPAARPGRPAPTRAGSGSATARCAPRPARSARAATALAVVVPVFIPTFGLELFGNGFGQGGGDEIKIENPMVDLQARPHPGRRTSRHDPRHAPTTPTPVPADRGAQPVLRQRVELRRPQGADRAARRRRDAAHRRASTASVPTKSYDYEVTITDDFNSTWLPTQAPISGIEAPGDWRYDISTMDFMPCDEDLTTAGHDLLDDRRRARARRPRHGAPRAPPPS